MASAARMIQTSGCLIAVASDGLLVVVGVVKDKPVPGRLAVVRDLPFLRLTVKPRTPIEVEIPRLLKLSQRPGPTLMRFLNRKVMAHDV